MLVALAALFVALGGVGVAATGGNFILGQSNAATTNTSLSAPVHPNATGQHYVASLVAKSLTATTS